VNEKHLSDAIAKQFFLTKVESKEIIRLLFTHIAGSLKNGDRAYFRGFGSFTKEKRSPKKVRHPKTKQIITIPARLTVNFKPSPKLLKKLA
jgi:nucleoid DNA-binding protein